MKTEEYKELSQKIERLHKELADVLAFYRHIFNEQRMKYSIDDPFFSETISKLDNFLSEYNYAIVGGVAVETYMRLKSDKHPLRRTGDIDLIISEDKNIIAKKLIDQEVFDSERLLIKKDDIYYDVNSYGNDVPVEFHFKKEIPKKQRIKINNGAEFYIIPLEMLLATRLERGLWKDMFDVGQLLLFYPAEINEKEIFNYVDSKKKEDLKRVYQKMKKELKSKKEYYKGLPIPFPSNDL